MAAINGTEQQIFDSLRKAKRVLIALPQNPNGDALGAGLAMFDFAKKLDKQAEIASAALDISTFNFLPQISEIKKELVAAQSFVISLRTQNAKLDELSYEVLDAGVDIYLKPKIGKFSEKDLSFRSAKFPYDFIFTFNVPGLDYLGELYERNTDLFFETPIINIDNHPSNEYYGEINLVDLTATSTSEILANILENFEESLIDEKIATNLLTGIIIGTNSFQNIKTTPKAFLRASGLIEKGGDHQKIIRELYKTKNISTLKLWGRALARLTEIPDLGLAYSLVNQSDLLKSGSSSADVLGVMKELVAILAGRKIILFLAETAPREITGYFHLHPSLKAQVVASALGGSMLNGSLGFFLAKDSSLLDVEKSTLDKLDRIKEQISI